MRGLLRKDHQAAVPLFGVLLVAWLGYKFLRSTWLRKRWAVRRS